MSLSKDTLQVPGFLANGIHVGIKAEGKKDLALLFSTVPSKAVGMFTTNSFKAAPVLIDMEKIESGVAQAILTNSGNANAATGAEGYRDGLATSRIAADGLHIADELVLVASTGIIGQPLPVDKIAGGIGRLVAGLSPQGFTAAEEAIMTTDKFPKIALRKGIIGRKEVTLCGLAKGAGMICPNMATMLAFFVTDADVDASALRSLFRHSVDKTFNAITVDGCMSTNDTVLLLANGIAGNRTVRNGSRAYALFREMLLETMIELSQAIVSDGEGATKVIDVNVTGASSIAEAKKAAYAVANSNLVKTAFFGGDPNWGRIISALGSAGVRMVADSVTVHFEDVAVFAAGMGVRGVEEKLAGIMTSPCIRLRVDLAAGERSFRVLASDLGFDYIKINAHYHT